MSCQRDGGGTCNYASLVPFSPQSWRLEIIPRSLDSSESPSRRTKAAACTIFVAVRVAVGGCVAVCAGLGFGVGGRGARGMVVPGRFEACCRAP